MTIEDVYLYLVSSMQIVASVFRPKPSKAIGNDTWRESPKQAATDMMSTTE